MPDEVVKTGVGPGDFPFPISDGPQESRYLTWIRNHSNYMAVRGLFDYFRAVAVLVRGALVNALVGLPFLLLIAVLVAMLHVLPAAPGFYVTRVVLVLALAAVVLFPFGSSLLKIRSYRKTFWTGTDSSVKARDRWERRFGFILISIVAVAAFESLPAFLDRFHFWAYERGIRWPELASVLGVVVALYSVSDRMLSVIGGVARKVALVAVAALGLLVPLLVVLFVADFLVFSHPAWDGNWRMLPLLAVAFLIVGLLLVMLVGILNRAFSVKDLGWMAALLAGLLALGVLVNAADDAYFEWTVETETELDARTRDLATAKEFAKEYGELMRSVESRPGPKLVELEERVAAFPPDGSAGGAPAAAPSTGSGAVLQAQLADLGNVAQAAALLEVEDLVHAIEARLKREPLHAANESRLVDELRNLRERAAVLPQLPRARMELVDLAVRHFERVEPLFGPTVDGDRHPYPLLSSIYRDTFEPADEVLKNWGWLLRDVRLEVTARAVYSPTGYPAIYKTTASVREKALWPKVTLVLAIAVLLWCFCWLTVDVNLTSIHGLYRDRLASAFLIGADTKGDVDIEEDLDLGDLCRHDAGSTAPYHLINVALNLQGSRDIGIRDRRSDFFVFSKRFIGGRRTGYCRSEAMERVFPQMSLSTAMAISAAAASPNMGRATSPALVALMTLLNVRLGIWVPNPGLLQQRIGPHARKPEDDDGAAPGFSFPEVFREELVEIERRWQQTPAGGQRGLAQVTRPTVAHRLVGIGFSGGGIRSATLNLGIAQALHRRGIFDHVDYMSTVSGGGYLGSSISALMRRRTRTEADVAGRVSVLTGEAGERIVRIAPEQPGWFEASLRRLRDLLARTPLAPPTGPREYRYAAFAQLAVEDGGRVRAGQRLLGMGESPGRGPGSFGELFRWRVRPGALLRELMSRLDETHRWVNVSDGGHIENLACIELLRRRCKYIVIGDGEADPGHRFNGLATLIRSARIDLGIHIDIDVETLRLGADRASRAHWACGRIDYPGEAECGYLLYLKSSVTGDEDEVIREYRHAHPSFPHESTADQMFNEGQFEAYRSLGQHIGENVLGHLPATGAGRDGPTPFSDLEQWFASLDEVARSRSRERA
jgi:hypothetical protein